VWKHARAVRWPYLGLCFGEIAILSTVGPSILPASLPPASLPACLPAHTATPPPPLTCATTFQFPPRTTLLLRSWQTAPPPFPPFPSLSPYNTAPGVGSKPGSSLPCILAAPSSFYHPFPLPPSPISQNQFLGSKRGNVLRHSLQTRPKGSSSLNALHAFKTRLRHTGAATATAPPNWCPSSLPGIPALNGRGAPLASPAVQRF